MKGLKDFIIKLDKPLNDTFKTESGLDIYAHKDFSVDRLSNRVAEVVAIPMFTETPVKVGYEVMIEPTILYKQIYRGVKQSYTSLIDNDDNLFKVTPNMIILYRENENEEWKGHLQNCLLEPIEDKVEQPKSSFLVLPDSVTKVGYKKGRAILKYSNDLLKSFGAKIGDEVILTTSHINNASGVKFWIEGKEFWWVKNNSVAACIV